MYMEQYYNHINSKQSKYTIKKQQLYDRIKEQGSTICCLEETHLKNKHLKVKNRKKVTMITIIKN